MPTGQNYQGRDGELRLLDKSQASAGASGTPWGIRVYFEQMDLTIGGQPRPEEIARLDRERLTSDSHRQIGSEEVFLEGTEVSFSAVISSQHTDAILDFVGASWVNVATANPNDPVPANAWNVKGTPAGGLKSTINRAVTGDGLYGGGRIDARGSAIVLPVFADKKKVAVDIETIWAERDGTNKWGMRLKEVFFDPGGQQVNESADLVTIQLTGTMYGTRERITAFSRAMDVLTSQLFS